MTATQKILDNAIEYCASQYEESGRRFMRPGLRDNADVRAAAVLGLLLDAKMDNDYAEEEIFDADAHYLRVILKGQCDHIIFDLTCIEEGV